MQNSKGAPLTPKDVHCPMGHKGASSDLKVVTWTSKYVICWVLAFIGRFAEAKLMPLEDGMAEFCNKQTELQH